MKKNYIVTALLCLSLFLAGCGQEAQSEETTSAPQITETTAPVTEPTEPEAVYEKQTVYLCVQEHLQNYEPTSGNFKKGYSYDEYGRVTEYFQIQEDGSRGWVQTYTYDEQGNNTEIHTGSGRYVKTYDEAGRLVSDLYYSGENCKSEKYYIYDEQGFVVERSEITRYSEEVTYKYVVTYDEGHREATIEQFKNGNPNGVTRETYNAAGQVLTSTVQDATGSWKSSHTWEYDKDGKLLQEGSYSRSEIQADYMTIYTYDENGLLISKNVDYYYGYLEEYVYEPFEILVRVK